MIRTPYSHIPHGSTCYVFLSSFLKHFFSIFVLIKVAFTHLPTSKNGIGRGGRNTGGAQFYTVPLVPWLSKKVSNGIIVSSSVSSPPA